MAACGTVWDGYDVEQDAWAGVSDHSHIAPRIDPSLRYVGQPGHLKRK